MRGIATCASSSKADTCASSNAGSPYCCAAQAHSHSVANPCAMGDCVCACRAAIAASSGVLRPAPCCPPCRSPPTAAISARPCLGRPRWAQTASLHIGAGVHALLSTCACAHKHTHTHTRIHAHWIRLGAHSLFHTQAHILTQTHKHTHTDAHMHKCAHPETHTHRHTSTHNTHKCARACVHRCAVWASCRTRRTRPRCLPPSLATSWTTCRPWTTSALQTARIMRACGTGCCCAGLCARVPTCACLRACAHAPV